METESLYVASGGWAHLVSLWLQSCSHLPESKHHVNQWDLPQSRHVLGLHCKNLYLQWNLVHVCLKGSPTEFNKALSLESGNIPVWIMCLVLYLTFQNSLELAGCCHGSLYSPPSVIASAAVYNQDDFFPDLRSVWCWKQVKWILQDFFCQNSWHLKNNVQKHICNELCM